MDTGLFTLLIFTLLGGTAASISIMKFAVQLGGKIEDRKKNSEFILYLVALILLGVGLFASLLHLGQPLRFLNGLSNPTSMISQESYWSIGLGVLLLACVLLAKLKGAVPQALKGLTAFAGAGLLVVSALAYALPMGMPGWNDGSTVPFLALANLVLGAGVIILLDKTEAVQTKTVSALIVLEVALVIASIGFMINLATVGFGSLLVPLTIALFVGAIAPVVIAAYRTTTKAPATTLIILIAVLAIVGLVAVRIIFFFAGVHL